MYNVPCPVYSYVPAFYDPSMVQDASLGYQGPVPIVLPQANLVAEAGLASNLILGGIGRVQSGRIQKKEKKFARTKWSATQEKILAEAFAESQDIGSRMSELVDSTGLPEKTIKVYFANHRARCKKSQKEEKPRKPGRPRKLTEVSEGYGSLEGSPDFAGGLEQVQYMNHGYSGQNLNIHAPYIAPAQNQAQFASGNYYCPPQNGYSNPVGFAEYSNPSANYYPQMAYCTPQIPQEYYGNFASGDNMPSGQIEKSPISEAPLEQSNEDFLQNAMQIAGIESAEEPQPAPQSSEAQTAPEDNWDEVLEGFENY
ncbi:unnamed protein product [Bursaphelenchus xylophilus]|uniref:(pine wood nematode) hypothetical protein n=1 Tax=Bursaphelenchus xylophilus TaxID=6326 RepID=A0A7I8X825_BURXY|nr:unnamed protein product [Bursaphelenchus xylophilus]CAG9126164.1 unnamed protein product [Bursaphelenchus xylophilus]